MYEKSFERVLKYAFTYDRDWSLRGNCAVDRT